MPKVGETTFFGASRTVYTFGVYNLDSSFKDRISAVYAFSATDSKGRHQLLFVGETDKLGIDVPRQKALPIIRGGGAAHVCVHLDDDEQSRRSTASDLIEYYKPSGNFK